MNDASDATFSLPLGGGDGGLVGSGRLDHRLHDDDAVTAFDSVVASGEVAVISAF